MLKNKVELLKDEIKKIDDLKKVLTSVMVQLSVYVKLSGIGYVKIDIISQYAKVAGLNTTLKKCIKTVDFNQYAKVVNISDTNSANKKMKKVKDDPKDGIKGIKNNYVDKATLARLG